MANSATADDALPIKGTNYGSVTPYAITFDTVQSTTDVKTAVTGKMIGIVGMALQNNHASGAQTIIFYSGTTEITRKKIAAAEVWELKDAAGGYFAKAPFITTQPGEKLAMRLNDATNQPINGHINLAVAEVWEIV